jgi:hypothetical protein
VPAVAADLDAQRRADDLRAHLADVDEDLPERAPPAVLDGTDGLLRGLEDRPDCLDGLAHVAAGVHACLLDGGQHGPHGVDHEQQHVGGGGVQGAVAVAQAGQEVLPDVGDLLQVVEAEEAARALDGVDGAEHAGQQVTGLGRPFELHEVPVHLVEVLVALHEELLDDLVHAVRRAAHGASIELCTRPP